MSRPAIYWEFVERQIRKRKWAFRLATALAYATGSVVAPVLYVARVRFLRLTAPGRIGHLCMDPAMFVKRRALGLADWCYGVLISPPSIGANECLLEYWRRYLIVVRSPLLAALLSGLTKFRYLVYDATTAAINETSPHIEVERQWAGRPPLLQLTGEHRRETRAILSDLGIPADAEFVCIHCREPGFSPEDDDSQSYRDSSIENYLLAAELLAARGIWSIRMGGPTTRPLAGHEKLVDYAHSSTRSASADLFLSASCKFFLGGSSGLIFVASTFGRPSGSANHAPLSSVLSFGAQDVAIPKLLWSDRENRLLTFAEAFGSDVANFRYKNLYRQAGVRTIENAPEDIRDLALEMLERGAGSALYSAADEERQRRFKSLLRPGHYSYGGVNRVGRDFLRKYESLLG